MPRVPDKFIVIGIIQNVLTGIDQASGLMGGKKSEHQKGIFMGLFICLRYIYVAITGNEWEKSPKELTEWMQRYIKNEADAAGRRQ